MRKGIYGCRASSHSGIVSGGESLLLLTAVHYRLAPQREMPASSCPRALGPTDHSEPSLSKLQDPLVSRCLLPQPGEGGGVV